MSALDELENEEMIVMAVEFNIDTITIHFQEKREVAETAIVTRTMEILINDDKKAQRYLDLQDFLRSFIQDTYEEDIYQANEY